MSFRKIDWYYLTILLAVLIAGIGEITAAYFEIPCLIIPFAAIAIFIAFYNIIVT